MSPPNDHVLPPPTAEAAVQKYAGEEKETRLEASFLRAEPLVVPVNPPKKLS